MELGGAKGQRKKMGPKAGRTKKQGKVKEESQSNRKDDVQTPDAGANEDEWCAVCHDGGDTLYCCDRCPKVYHLYCYIPPLTSEPPDDWVCLMCATYGEIQQFSNKKDKGANLGDRDLKISRRILFELYNQYPESYAFRDCSDLNFPEYMEKVREPIALDIIKERLNPENPEQYGSVEAFLSDVRRMFRNCYKFHAKDSEYFLHAKALEEYLDRQLEIWLPELAYDQTVTDKPKKEVAKKNRSQSPVAGPSKKRRKSPEKEQKKKKKKRMIVEDDGCSSMSESEQLDYLDALEKSLEDFRSSEQDPKDDDDEEDYKPDKTSSKGKASRPKRSLR